MPTLKKLLSKFSKEERETIGYLIEVIISSRWQNLDVKKLKGHQDVFRVRSGKIRIIFRKDKSGVYIFSIERRSDNTYKL